MKINELKPAIGAVKTKKRVGRGEGSGTGKTSGRGENGQKSRSGYSKKLHFEGGQIPLIRKLPKRGFKSRSKIEFAIINIGLLENIAEEIITPDLLVNLGMIKENLPLKVLGDGALTKTKEVHAHAFSKSAVEKISEAKGKAVSL